MSLGALCAGALVLAIAVSCVTQLNVGVLSIALAWIIGVYVGGLPVATVMAGFPTQLFLTLAGVTLLFALAQTNGTLDKVAHHAVRTCRGNRGMVAVMFFVMAAALATMGPGNIASIAIMAPMAMSTASRVGIPLFLMAIMVGNGANAGSLSPFAPTGIIVTGIMERIGLGGLEWQTYAYNLAAHASVAFGGFLLFGGWKLFGKAGDAARNQADLKVGLYGDGAGPGVPHAGQNISVPETGPARVEPGDAPLEPRHWLTIAAIATLILTVIFFGVNVGMGAFTAAIVLVAFRAADENEAIRKMPWRVILMVCGVTVLIALLERAQGMELLVGLVARLSTAESVAPVVALLTGIVSVYSSTSGVVLPAFLPMVPGLAERLAIGDPLGIAASMNIGAHLVDMSPLSTTGALCIAAAPATADNRRLFNQLLAWGLSMCVVGALISYVMFSGSAR